MKRAALIAALVVSLATYSAAEASPGGRGHDRYRDAPHARYDHRRNYCPRASGRSAYRGPARYGTYVRPYGYYTHRWSRGERLPVAYYAGPYLIADCRPFGLWVPPRGCHWMRVGGDAVLAAVATGIVLDTVFHVFH